MTQSGARHPAHWCVRQMKHENASFSKFLFFFLFCSVFFRLIKQERDTEEVTGAVAWCLRVSVGGTDTAFAVSTTPHPTSKAMVCHLVTLL
jgi:hypothetical protein